MTERWDAKLYSQFIDLRTKPARDLLAAIPESLQPKTIYDLGCGPGNSTVLLKNRWPHANVIGIDSSSDMLNEARSLYPHISFVKEDIAHFSLTEKTDFLFANASLQWLPRHDILFPKLFQLINPGGAFAIQMPNNFHSPSHQVTIRLLKNNKAWQPLLKKLCYGELTESPYKLPWYYELLIQTGIKDLQLWETDYLQEMRDYQGIFDWGKGTGLRPVLLAMDAVNQAQFKDAYVEAISQEYPMQSNNKILLPFKRLFLVGFPAATFCAHDD